MDEWEPVPLDVPSLLVTAAEAFGDAAEEPLPGWQSTADVIETAGDHFSMIEREAGTTAETVVNWLAGVTNLTSR